MKTILLIFLALFISSSVFCNTGRIDSCPELEKSKPNNERNSTTASLKELKLLNKAFENTWKTFKDENVSRAYCRCLRKTNNYVAQTIDLDLDIVQ